MSEKSTRTPQEVYKYHQERVFSMLDRIEAQAKEVKSDLNFEPGEVDWEKSNNMRSISMTLAAMSECIYEVANKEFIYERDHYKDQIEEGFKAFEENLGKESKVTPELKEEIESQKEFLLKSNPDTFYKVRHIASKYLEKHGEDIAKSFKDSLSLPKAQEREKGQDKGKGKGMERE